jgi:hypothetical protein
MARAKHSQPSEREGDHRQKQRTPKMVPPVAYPTGISSLFSSFAEGEGLTHSQERLAGESLPLHPREADDRKDPVSGFLP